MKNQSVQTKRSKTALKIIAAARDAFSEHGFAGTTVDEIARHTGVNKATLYYHIGDKETLYAAVIHDVMGTAADAIARDIENTPAPEEKLKTYIRNVAGALDRNPWIPPIILREMAAGGGNLPVRELFRIFSLLAQIIEEGVRQGVFIAANPSLVHLMIMGPFVFYKTSAPLRARQDWLSEEWKQGRGLVFEEIAGELEILILRALKKVP